MMFHASVTLDSFEKRCDELLRAGFQPEVRMTDIGHMMALPQADLTRLGRLIEERALTVFTHGPYLGLDIASLNRYLSAHSTECLLRGLAVTSALHGRIMVMHTNYLPFYPRAGLREWLGNWNARMPAVIEAARHFGITIAIENAWEGNPLILEHLVDLLPKGEVAVCLDIGHINVFSRLPVKRWWDVLGERVVALHLHDNDGLSDDHLPPGKGIADLPALVDCLRGRSQLPLMTLEVDLPAAIEGKSYLEGLFAETARKGG